MNVTLQKAEPPAPPQYLVWDDVKLFQWYEQGGGLRYKCSQTWFLDIGFAPGRIDAKTSSAWQSNIETRRVQVTDVEIKYRLAKAAEGCEE